MSYYCCLAEDYKTDPKRVTWHESRNGYSPETAARYFMEEVGDPENEFGLRETTTNYMHVLVFDEDEDILEMVEVEAVPQPGYECMMAGDIDRIKYDTGIEMDTVVGPEFSQIVSS